MKLNKPNVLLLSAGRRVELIKAFKLELQRPGLQSSIFATDLNHKMSAACRTRLYGRIVGAMFGTQGRSGCTDD
jgi:hypothetical protein